MSTNLLTIVFTILSAAIISLVLRINFRQRPTQPCLGTPRRRPPSMGPALKEDRHRDHMADVSSQSHSSSARKTVFRVRGIPANNGDHSITIPEVEQLIRRAFSVELEITILVESLANSPIIQDVKARKELTSLNEMVATIRFSETPHFLAHDLKEVDAEPFNYGGGGVDGNTQKIRLTLDSHFYGITPLSTPKSRDYLVDVIAISGLNGHAFGSFKAKESPFIWLRDDLPHSLPGARIWTYGFDLKLVESSSYQSLLDLGVKFANMLRMERSGTGTLTAPRPLILIGHSLGGLIVQQALCTIAESRNEKDVFILRCVYGILFFGVPNQGMAIESLLPMVKGQPNESFVRCLAIDQSALRSLSREFSNLIEKWQNMRIMSFYETVESPTAALVNGKWSMSGPPAPLVGISSATHGRPWETGQQYVYPINKNHSELVKFRPHDTDYEEAVLPFLRTIIGDAKTNWPLSQEQKECLRSISFPEQNFRPDQIANAEQNTCTWILNNSAYVKWLNTRGGLLWVEGSPGVGKSTVMKFITQSLEEGATKRHTLILSFFFHGRGSDLQKTPTGLYRSILNQLLPFHPDALAELTVLFRERCTRMGPHGTGWTWGPSELEGFLRQYLHEAAESRHIIILVDALDECGSHSARNLKRMFSSVTSYGSQSKHGLKICFSCRYYPNLKPATIADEDTIAVEEENGADIATVVSARLSDMSPTKRSVVEASIIGRARGVFQWVIIVCARMSELDDEGASIQRLHSQLQQLPQDLNDLYSSLLERLSGEELPQAIRLFLWLCFAKRPLRIPELRYILVYSPESTETSVQALHTSENFREDIKDVTKAIKTLSKGLAEVKQGWVHSLQSVQTFAQLIHQSVLDYLFRYWFTKFLPTRYQSATGYGHFVLSRSCIRYLSLKEVRDYAEERSPEEVNSQLDDKFQLVSYAVTYLDYHLECVEADHVPQSDLIDLFTWPVAAKMSILAALRKKCSEVELNNTDTPTGFLHLLANLGINTALEILIRDGGSVAAAPIDVDQVMLLEKGKAQSERHFDNAGHLNINIRDSRGRVPLHYAVMRGRLASVESLLKTNTAQLDVVDVNGKTPFDYAFQGNRLEIILKLIASETFDTTVFQNAVKPILFQFVTESSQIEIVEAVLTQPGVPLDVRDDRGRTLLHFAVCGSSKSLVETLLKRADVDLNATDNRNETALHVTAYSREYSHIYTLLDLEATNPNIENAYGDTPLKLSIRRMNAQAVEAMLSSQRVNPKMEPPPLIFALQVAFSGPHYPYMNNWGDFLEIFRVLMRSDRIDPNQTNGHKWSQIMAFACEAYEHDEAVQSCLHEAVFLLLADPRASYYF